MAKVFLVLGVLWLGFSVKEFVTGEPTAWRAPLLTAGLNLVVALYLFWRGERRQRAGR